MSMCVYWLQCEMYFLLCVCSTHHRVTLSLAKQSDSHLAPVYLECNRAETSTCQVLLS